ncbi:MAG: FIST signal transduction protein, partial [Wenzhouxiangella sp.]
RGCILSPDGLLADAAICARLPVATSIGVRHGWTPASDPMVVTESRKNVIYTLDHEAAFPAYRRIVEQHGGAALTTENFFEQARHFPFGIQKSVADTIIRDPVRIDQDGGLVCVGEVATGSTVRIMQGTGASLISAAREARANVDEYMLNTRGSCYLVIDCISRTLVLGERMDDELATVSQNDLSFGALTLGEIANMGQEFLEFYNTTIVVARFDEKLEPYLGQT